MIRYPIRKRKLEALVDDESPATNRKQSWRDRAKEKTDEMRTAGKFLKGPSWSEIKKVYMRLQNNKCAYCEKRLEAEDVGAGEHDVEHYRPKNPVRSWNYNDEITFNVNDGSPNGYYILAYNLQNYCTSCRSCNSTLKYRYFPIEGQQELVNVEDIRSLNRLEKPFIPYPIGSIDENPEKIISFEGTAPVPVTSRGKRHRRALVTIKFFKLDTREELLLRRAEILNELWRIFEDLASSDSQTKEDA